MNAAAGHRRFIWQIEIPIILVLVIVVAAVTWYAEQGEQRQQRAADTRAAAISAAQAIERAAAKANGSYARLDGKTSSALDRYGYDGSTRVTITINATTTSYCLVATDAGLSGSQWRQASIRTNARTLQAGNHC